MIQISIFAALMFIAVALVIALLLFAGARTAFANFFLGLGYLIQAGFLAIRNLFRPLAGGGVGIIGILGLAILVLLLFFGGIYLMAVLGIIAIGGAIGNVGLAFIIIGLLVALGFSRLPWVRGILPVAWLRYFIIRPAIWAVSVIMIVGLAWWIFGHISPQGHRSIGRSAENSSGELWNGLDKKSLQSEPEMGKFAKIKQDVYATTSGAPFFIRKDTIVMIIGLNGQKSNDRSEGRIQVMVKNKYGHYDGGEEGWVPTRVVDWNWKCAGPRHLVLNRRENQGKVLYGLEGVILQPGEYRSNRPVFVFSGKDDPHIATNTERFTLSREVNATIASYFSEIVLTPQ